MSNEITDVKDKEVEDVEEEQGLEVETEDEKTEDLETVGAEDKDKKEEVEEPPRFKLDVQDDLTTETDKNNDMIDIVHNGQGYKLTKEKVIELAQKGFDYDYKVGPHGKIVKMIEADPEIAKIVTEHWDKKVSGGEDQSHQEFKVKPLDEYDSESDWLKDNLQQAIEFGRATAPKQQPAPQPARNTAISDALQMRDPENFNKVLPKLSEYAGQLSVTDYQRVDSDMGALCQFYDYVKSQVIKPTESVQSAQPNTTSQSGFRVKSGGGQAPRSGEKEDAAWQLSKKDFQKQLDKIKGVG